MDMDYNKLRHKELLIRSQELKNQGKTLFQENQNDSSELLNYEIAVEEQIFWAHREKFVLIMKNFLDSILNFDEFETSFTLLYIKTRREFDMFRTNLKQIENFQPSTRHYRFANLINSIYRQFEDLENESCTEQDIKNSVNTAYLRFQNN